MLTNVEPNKFIAAGPMMSGVPYNVTGICASMLVDCEVAVAEEAVAMARKGRTNLESIMLLWLL
jgi:hypothetical protein